MFLYCTIIIIKYEDNFLFEYFTYVLITYVRTILWNMYKISDYASKRIKEKMDTPVTTVASQYGRT